MNAPENQFLSVLQRNSIKGDLILGSLGRERGAAQGTVSYLNQDPAIYSVPRATIRDKNHEGKEDKANRVQERATLQRAETLGHLSRLRPEFGCLG